MLEIQETQKKANLTEFVFAYLQTHNFVGKQIIAGMYVDRFNLKNDIFYGNSFSDGRMLLKHIKSKISSLFVILKSLGIIETYNKNTIHVVDRDLMNEIGLNKILEHYVRRGNKVYQKKGKRGKNLASLIKTGDMKC